MIKLLGVTLIIICGAVSGAIASSRLKEQTKTANLAHSMIIRVSVLLRYNAQNVYEIVSELRADSNFSELAFLQSMPTEYIVGEDFSAQWSQAVDGDLSLGNEEKSVLKSFGSTFGTTDACGQLTLIESTAEELRKICRMREGEYNRKGKLYRSVGMLTGVMTGIALI